MGSYIDPEAIYRTLVLSPTSKRRHLVWKAFRICPEFNTLTVWYSCNLIIIKKDLAILKLPQLLECRIHSSLGSDICANDLNNQN